MTATADLPNKNIQLFTEKFSFAAGDKSIILDSEDGYKIKLIAKTLMKGDDGAKAVSVAFVGDDMVFTLDDSSTVTLTDAKTDLKGDQGIQGNPGADGTDGATITSAAFVGNNLVFTLDDASTVTIVDAKLDLKGDTGDTGEDGTDGEDGVGITSITKTGTVGLVDTYTILYTDSTTSTFDITNGEDGTNGTNGVDGTDGISFTPKGAYSAGTAYVANDVVSYLGSSWTALQNTTGNTPVEGANWTLLAAKGTDGEGAGDMLKATYDPTEVEGDAFDMDNMAQGDTKKYVSATDITNLGNLSGTNTGDETTTTLGSKINGATEKNTPVDADMVGLMDSAASNILKKLSWANIKATLKTYFDTLYQTTLSKATGTDIDTGTDDAKYVTSKAIDDSKLSYTDGTETLTNKTLTSPKINENVELTATATELNYVDGVTSAIQTQLDSKRDTTISINAQTGTSYTLVLSDAGKLVTLTNSSAITLTVPPNSSVAFPTGTQIDLSQDGDGAVTVTEGSGVTVNSKDDNLKSNGQYVGLTLIKTGTDTWNLYGDLTT